MSKLPDMNDELLTRKEISLRLKLSERTVRRWMHDGKVPYHRYGYKINRFMWSEVMRALGEREKQLQAELDAKRKAAGE
ncbi:MAG: helix-turn-helix domain-containing protein [Verrucomicrobiota bacterium]